MQVFKRWVMLAPLLGLAAILVGLPGVAIGREDDRDFRARLDGLEEVPPINTGANGTLRLRLSNNSIEFELRYSNLSRQASVAHIHFGPPRVNGGVMVFFCGGGGKPACPDTTSATIRGTIEAADVVGPTGQGVKAGDMAAVQRIIRNGNAYANVHNELPFFPGGEIRGQIRNSDD